MAILFIFRVFARNLLRGSWLRQISLSFIMLEMSNNGTHYLFQIIEISRKAFKLTESDHIYYLVSVNPINADPCIGSFIVIIEILLFLINLRTRSSILPLVL